MHYSSSTSLLSILNFVLLLVAVVSASPVIKPRDNQCTACQAIFVKLNNLGPTILFPPPACTKSPNNQTIAEKAQVFNTQICDSFNASQANGFGALVNSYCHQFVGFWGKEIDQNGNGGLFDYLEQDLVDSDGDGSKDSVEVLSACLKFRSC